MHSFHIPVLGTGFSVDTPLRVAPFGISSVVSLVDDQLIEQMYRYHLELAGGAYVPIRRSEPAARARRITRYLNLLHERILIRFESIRSEEFSPTSELTKYFELLPFSSPLRMKYEQMRSEQDPVKRTAQQDELRQHMELGSIDVNIMTKLDRPHFRRGSIVESEQSDALAALSGFADSVLNSAVVLSAGVNTRLFQEISLNDEFLPTEDAPPRKRVILKVSDFRSALTQGKMLAKKGVWVSEFRIESGLNCGGHAFPTQGELMAEILSDFQSRREELIQTVFSLYRKSLQQRFGWVPSVPFPVRFSAQGGVGDGREHQFLLQHFQLDSVGWGTPFLLVPEATVVETESRSKLMKAQSSDVFLSESSPLGVPFYTLKNSESEQVRQQRIDAQRPGSPCFNKYVALNTEYEGEPLCVASQSYQRRKLAELQQDTRPMEQVNAEREKILKKACICFDLGASARQLGRSEVSPAALHPAVCPGPNIAYFSDQYSLKEMVDHIYGRESRVKLDPNRPHVFLKEALLYADYLDTRFDKAGSDNGAASPGEGFRRNLHRGVEYLEQLVHGMLDYTEDDRDRLLQKLQALKGKLFEGLGALEVGTISAAV